MIRKPTRSATVERITVLKCVRGVASKRIIAREDGTPEIHGYNAGALFSIFPFQVCDIASLSATLRSLENHPDALVIRGEPLPTLDAGRSHRRTKQNFETPQAGRQWMLVDFDKITLPAGLGLRQDIRAVCEHLIALLPKEFHDASYHWQLSSSAGLSDDTKVSMHLWFWLDRPIPDAELKAWGKRVNELAGRKLVDPALYNDVQAHYTAAPQFQGMTDPFPVRSGLVRKRLEEVALQLPAPTKSARIRRAPYAQSLQRSGGFDAVVEQIGDHPGGDGFHEPIIRAVASFVATAGADNVDVDALYERVRERVLAADRSGHDEAYVNHMASREHIIPAIEGAIAKFGKLPATRRKSRQVPGVAPHFTANPVSVAKASTKLQRLIDGFFGP